MPVDPLESLMGGRNFYSVVTGENTSRLGPDPDSFMQRVEERKTDEQARRGFSPDRALNPLDVSETVNRYKRHNIVQNSLDSGKTPPRKFLSNGKQEALSQGSVQRTATLNGDMPPIHSPGTNTED